MSKIPYIGITDFTELSQVEKINSLFCNTIGCLVPIRLHVGVMMSYKTLNGIETKWSKAFPANEKIEEIFSSKDPNVMNCLHYADYEEIGLEENLIKAINFGGKGINAVQLDMIWPCPRKIENALSKTKKNLEVILQVGKDAIERAQKDPMVVVDHLISYNNIADYVLLDLSMGQGKDLNSDFLFPFIEAIKDHTDFNIAVAGGLGPKDEDINLIKPILEKYPDMSFDAQSKLRRSKSALDPIDWDLAEEYMIKSLELVG